MLQVVRLTHCSLVDESALEAWLHLGPDLVMKRADVGCTRMAWQFHIRSDGVYYLFYTRVNWDTT